MITLNSCPNCKSRDFSKYQRVVTLSRNIFVELIPGVKVETAPVSYYFLCQKCNLIFQNPRLSDSEIDVFYNQGYYRRMLDGTNEEGDFDQEYRARYDAELIKRFVGNIKSHLDIGCGRGYLLDSIGAHTKVGVEPDPDYVTFKDIKVYLRLSQVKGEPFDLVTAIHVLEHEPYPLEYLQSMKRYVSKNGYVVLEVPSSKSPGGPLRLAHLYQFEAEVLKNLCEEAGFRVISQQLTPHLLFICKPIVMSK